MKIRKIFFSLVVGISLASTSALASKDEQVIWEKDPNVFVKLSQQADAQNQHPSTVSTENLQQFFSNVTYKPSKNSEQKPVFTETQVKELSTHVQRALSKASTYQDVVFSIDRIEKTFGGLSSTEYLTAGTVFLASSGINLILGDLDRKRDSAYESVYDPTGQGLVKYDLDHGSRQKATSDYQLAFAGADKASTNASTSWLTVPLDTVAEVTSRNAAQKLQATTGVPADVVKREELDALLEKQAQSVRAEIKQAMTEVQASQAATQSPKVVETNLAQSNSVEQSKSAGKAAPTESLAERFKVLKELRELGLITEEEYQSKRKELLSEI